MDNSKCAVLVPIASVLEPETDVALRALIERGYAVRTLRGSAQVDLARSTLATEALRDGYEETMWIDSDIVFHPDQVDQLRSLDVAFSAALYPCKGPKRLAGKFLPNSGQVPFGEYGQLIEVEYVGMGFTHVRREVYEDIAKRCDLPAANGGYWGNKVIPFFFPMILPERDGGGEGGCYLSEDYSFCVRARQARYRPLVDTRIKLGHVGKKVYTWDDLVANIELDSVWVEMKQSGEIEIANTVEEQTDGTTDQERPSASCSAT